VADGRDAAPPLFCGVELARRIEEAERDFIAAATRACGRRTGSSTAFVSETSGGAACYAEQGSPMNKVVGLGFIGAPSTAELGDIERAYRAVDAPVQVELANLADPAIADTLTGRGYRLVSFENVLGVPLTPAYVAPVVTGVEVRLSEDADFDTWIDVTADAFAHPDDEGVPSHEDFPREVLANAERDVVAAGVVRYSALSNGVLAGAGSVRIAGRVAQLAGAGTAPSYRRRGVQTALLGARLAGAAAAGCEIAVVTTRPGSRSQRNVSRRGFQLLYTRAILVLETDRRPAPASSGPRP
jgi:GNAT superfamily N-acetyltransferase